MVRRFLFFGIGVLISVIFLSMGPENRLKTIFHEYINWGDSDKWVVNHLLKPDDLIFSDNLTDKLIENEIDTAYLLRVLDGGWVNRDKNKKIENAKYYVIDNIVGKNELSVHFSFYEEENKVIIEDFDLNNGLSKKSYFSYFVILVIFLVIMIPVGLLVRKLIRQISL